MHEAIEISLDIGDMQEIVVYVNNSELNQIPYFTFKTEDQDKIMEVEVSIDFRSENKD